MGETSPNFELPGFRFHPTEEELLSFYLKNMVNGKKMNLDIIGLLNIYRHDPWDLPGLAKIGEREWYFFVPRDRKNNNGGRPNRTTERGFWKATGSDRKIVSLSEPKRVIGLRKTLVFYNGRAPRGSKTDWVMNEYRLPDNYSLPKDIVLCKIYRKATSLKELEQRAAKEEYLAEERSTTMASSSYPTSPLSSSNNGTPSSFYATTTSNNNINDNNNDNNNNNIIIINDCHHQIEDLVKLTPIDGMNLKEEEIVVESNCKISAMTCNSNNGIQLPFGKEGLGELQVPKQSMDWAQDPLWGAQSCSPWLENLLNFSSPTLLSQFLFT